MALYLTQKMSSGTLEAITYYRKQTNEHPSHTETGKFTQDAKNNYATFNHIPVANVRESAFKSGQGIPTGGKTYEI
jgi:hypothetical protein